MWVDVYDEKFRVNQRTGKNFDKVLLKAEGLVIKLTKKYISSFRYMTFDELKNELFAIAIDGIRNYNPKRRGDVKFSTFLTIHLENKLISLVRSDRKQANNASSLVNEGYATELPLYSMVGFSKAGQKTSKYERYSSVDNSIPAASNIFRGAGINPYDKSEFSIALIQVLNKRRKGHPIETDVLYRMYFEDKTIKELAKEHGLSGWAISMRIKKFGERYLKDLKIPASNGYEFELPKVKHVVTTRDVTINLPPPTKSSQRERKATVRKPAPGTIFLGGL